MKNRIYLIFFLFLSFLLITLMAILKYFSLHSTFYDLGIFDYLLFYNANFNFIPPFRVHAHLFVIFYTFLYKIFPSPVLLIICQSIAIFGAIWLIIKISKNLLNNCQLFNPILIFLLFLLYPPIWYNCLFDFHFEHLFIFFCALFYWLILGKKSSSWIFKLIVFFVCILCCLVKEVFALSAAMMGIYVIIKKRWWITGILIVLCSLLYFLFIELYAIPYFSDGKDAASMWHGAFGYLGNNMKEILLNLLTHPWIIITETFSNWKKVFYLIAIFGPLLFIPLLAPIELLPALPQLIISLLSHLPNHYNISNHYTAGLIVPIFVAFIIGLPKAKRIFNNFFQNEKLFLKIILFSSLLFHILLSPSPISQKFWRNEVWLYNYRAYIPTDRDNMIKKAIKKYIPKNPDISVATQNSLNWAYLAHRKHYFCFPKGVTEPAKVPDFSNKNFKQFLKHITNSKSQTPNYKLIYADLVLLDFKRLWFINDIGCNKWKNNQCYNKTFSQKFLNLLKETKKRYNLIYEKDGFMIFKRK